MKKAVIVRGNDATVYCEFLNDKPVRAEVLYDDQKNVLGNIYVGYVKDIVKNINCAFVEYEVGQKAYLPLSSTKLPVFLNTKNTNKLCEGDRIIVQISKDAIKTKDAVCTTNFELVGKYTILSYGGKGISFSKKIGDTEFKSTISEALSQYITEDYNLLIRTNAYNAPLEHIKREVASLSDKYYSIINIASTRPKNSLLYEGENPVYSILRDLYLEEGDRIVTDCKEIYDDIISYGLKPYTEFYQDSLLPLYKLNSLESVFEDITNRKIWLKSGAYLIIDYTEAMTVIDVNTGKCDKGKDKEKTFLNINLEAAKEIARLLSLRNISGIIIIDFIDMKDSKNRQYLLSSMKEYTSYDRIGTNVVDFTRLNLMEITRKKTRGLVQVRDGLFYNP